MQRAFLPPFVALRRRVRRAVADLVRQRERELCIAGADHVLVERDAARPGGGTFRARIAELGRFVVRAAGGGRHREPDRTDVRDHRLADLVEPLQHACPQRGIDRRVVRQPMRRRLRLVDRRGVGGCRQRRLQRHLLDPDVDRDLALLVAADGAEAKRRVRPAPGAQVEVGDVHQVQPRAGGVVLVLALAALCMQVEHAVRVAAQAREQVGAHRLVGQRVDQRAVPVDRFVDIGRRHQRALEPEIDRVAALRHGGIEHQRLAHRLGLRCQLAGRQRRGGRRPVALQRRFAAALLLRHMHQLVRKQALSGAAVGRVLACAEHDVAPDRERTRADAARRPRRCAVGMDSNSAEVCLQTRLEALARRRCQRCAAAARGGDGAVHLRVGGGGRLQVARHAGGSQRVRRSAAVVCRSRRRRRYPARLPAHRTRRPLLPPIRNSRCRSS